jgi:hypothetical protein
MGVPRILCAAVAVGVLVAHIIIATSITSEVNERLGKQYKGVWSLQGDEILKEHERLFPDSRKRAAFFATFVAAFILFFATGFVPGRPSG